MFAKTLFLSLILSTTVVAAAADRVQAGEWESTLSIGAGQPMLTTYCITAAEARQMSGDLATLKKYLEESTATSTKGRCTVKNVALNANRTTVTLVCGKTEVTNTTTYHGDHYASTSSNGATVSGKRLGVCPKN
jgi:hypothetical protein